MPLDDDLVGSWDLISDGRDGSGHGHDAIPRGSVAFAPSVAPGMARPVALFGGGSGHLEIAAPAVGGDDFTLTAWLNARGATTAIGDVLAAFDPAARRGFSLGLSHSSSCGNHGNDRNLFFGLDAGSDVAWTAHGRPSPSTIMVCALAVHAGDLYAATWEAGSSNVGRVYRLDDQAWVDCGAPWSSNAVTRLATHDGHLYAGVSRLRGGGSGMPDSINQSPGGRILRYGGGTDWSDCGQLDGADSVAGLVPFDGSLYAIPMYSEGLFRMTPSSGWEACGTPGRRLLALGVHDGALFGAGNDHADVVSAIAQTAAGVVVPARSSAGGGGMFRYDGGASWSSLGLQPDTTQVYSIETYDGGMFIGTWPHGLVFRHAGGESWEGAGRLGDETEVMNLLAYNGMLYAGTLPGAKVYRFDRDGQWTAVGRLDRTPDVLYRRAASMVVFRGELFCGTLPSGTVHSMRAGLVATDDRSLAAGWRHVAAVRAGRTIELHVDGSLVARRIDVDAPSTLDVGSSPLLLGRGPRGGFDGELADVRLYRRALDETELAAVATLSRSGERT